MCISNEATISKHARERMDERGIEDWQLFTVIRDGEYSKRGEDIRVSLQEAGDELSDLIVVLSADEQVVITAFWQQEVPEGEEPGFTLGEILEGVFNGIEHSAHSEGGQR